jgi:hypothetical protein
MQSETAGKGIGGKELDEYYRSSLEQKVGFNQRDYEQWLKDKKRHHDLSNLFEFIDWVRRRDDELAHPQ